MATRPQEAAQRDVRVPAKSKNGKPQQDIVNKESLRRLYAIVLKSRGAKSGGRKTVVDAAATIELTNDDAVASESGGFSVEQHAAGNSAGPMMVPQLAAGASLLSIAAGVALGKKSDGKQGVVVALATAESLARGASFEAMNYASAHKLPLVIVVDNVGDATRPTHPDAVGMEHPRRPEFLTIAQAHGVPAFLVDGEDAVAVYRVAREAIHRARSGRGPSLVECRAFDSQEDPLRHLESYLEKHGLWTPEWKRELSRAGM